MTQRPLPESLLGHCRYQAAVRPRCLPTESGLTRAYDPSAEPGFSPADSAYSDQWPDQLSRSDTVDSSGCMVTGFLSWPMQTSLAGTYDSATSGCLVGNPL